MITNEKREREKEGERGGEKEKEGEKVVGLLNFILPFVVYLNFLMHQHNVY